MAFRTQEYREPCVSCSNLTKEECSACEAPSCAEHGWDGFCEGCKQVLDERLAREGLTRAELNFDSTVLLREGDAAWNAHTGRVYRTRFIVLDMRKRRGRRLR